MRSLFIRIQFLPKKLIAQFSLPEKIGGHYCYNSALCSFMGNVCMLGGYNDVAAHSTFYTTFNTNPNTHGKKKH